MDVTLTASTTKKTLTLATDSNGTPLWNSYEVSKDSGAQDVPVWSQTDWSGGFGQGVFADPSRYSVGYCIDTSHKGEMFIGPNLTTGAIHGGAAWSGDVCNYCMSPYELFCITTYGAIYKWSTTDSHWDNVYAGQGSTVGTPNICLHGGNLYAAQGTSAPYVYATGGGAGTSWTAVTGYYAKYFCSAPPYAGSTPVLWRCDANNTISEAEDPTDGDDWGGDVYVGGTLDAINSLFIHQGQLYIGKTDGLYHYDSDGVVHKLLDVRYDPHWIGSYFSQIACMKGATYFNMGRMVGEITSYNAFDQIGPYKDISDITYYERYVSGLASDGENLFVCAKAYVSGVAHHTEIWKGTPLTDSDGNTRWAWCYWAYNTGTPGPIFYTNGPLTGSVNHPWLWVYTNSTTKYAVVSQHPIDAAYSYADSPTFAAQAYVETGWIDVGHRDWAKLIDSVLVEARMSSGDMSATKNVKLYYTTDDSSTYTAIDSVVSTATMGSKKYMDTAPITCKKVKFKIELNSDSSTVTPIVKYVAAYGSVSPPRKQLFDFTVLCETGHSAKAKDLRDFLVACRDAGTSGTYSTSTYLTLTDPFGTSHYVRFLPGYPTESLYITKEWSQPAMVMRVVCEDVDWS